MKETHKEGCNSLRELKITKEKVIIVGLMMFLIGFSYSQILREGIISSIGWSFGLILMLGGIFLK